jgi:protein TonB
MRSSLAAPSPRIPGAFTVSLFLHLAALGLGTLYISAKVAPPVLIPVELIPFEAEAPVAAMTPPQNPRVAEKKPPAPQPEPAKTAETVLPEKVEAPVPSSAPELTPAPAVRASEPRPEMQAVLPAGSLKVSHRVLPVYPMMARRHGLEGTVVLRVLVSETGGVGQAAVEASSGCADLDKAAVEAVRKWRFIPATRGGVAVAVWVRQPVTFRLAS